MGIYAQITREGIVTKLARESLSTFSIEWSECLDELGDSEMYGVESDCLSEVRLHFREALTVARALRQNNAVRISSYSIFYRGFEPYQFKFEIFPRGRREQLSRLESTQERD